MTAICARWNADGGDAAGMAARFAPAARRYGREPWRSWASAPVMLGKCAYPLLPEDTLGDPLDDDAPAGRSWAGRRWIVSADVRLTERDDLARQLGIDPATVSDSVMIALALEQWGEDAIDRIYGVFAIIAWDTLEQRLLLARDAMGERPLFYHRNAHGCSVASMPDILCRDPSVPMQPDAEQFRQLLRMNRFAPGRTAFEGIHAVRPGHIIIISREGDREIAWWQPDTSPLQLSSQAEYETALRKVLDQVVGAYLRRKSGKVGTHLSSGFDSTAVAATAAQILAASGEHITAFVAAPREGQQRSMASHHVADESILAACTTAMHANMDLVRIVPRTSPLSALSRARTLYAAPIINLCNLPWVEEINDHARDHGVSVLLHGSTGNISISESGVWALRELVRARRFGPWLKIARGLVRNGWMRWRGVMFNTVEDMLPDWLWLHAMKMAGTTIEDDRDMSLMSAPAYAEAIDEHCRAAAEAGVAVHDTDVFNRERGTSSVEHRMMMMRTNGQGDQYKAMLAEWGLDLRDATADRRLVELALRIPVERLIWDGEPRAILRRVLADRAPPEVLDNRKRGYQGADWAQAICQDRQAFIDEMERLEMYEPTAAFLDTAKIRRLIETMPETGSSEWDSDEAENSYRLACLRTISAASHMRAIARSNI